MLEAAVHTLGKMFFSSLWGSLLADQLPFLLLPGMWGPRVGARLFRDPLIKYLLRWLGPKPWWCVLKVLTTHQPSGCRHVGFWFLACGFCFYEEWRSGACSSGPSPKAGCCWENQLPSVAWWAPHVPLAASQHLASLALEPFHHLLGGLNCFPPKMICSCPHPWDLWMWPYLAMGSLQMY